MRGIVRNCASRAPFHPDPTASAERNRGAYLVDGLGHCATCHTAKNILGGDKRDGYLQGAVVQGWFVPNITGDPRVGISEWPPDEIVDYLKAGANHWTVVSGPMAEEVSYMRRATNTINYGKTLPLAQGVKFDVA
jgi:mono/diheme cytochrome c family protein